MRFARPLLTLAAFIPLLTSAVSGAPAAAQQPAPIPAAVCSGNINIIRISDIKPGMMPKFLEAVAAQKAWYKKAGVPDEISVTRVIEQSAPTDVPKLSETLAITNHIEPASRAKEPAHDAGFGAFVALFKDSSTIKTQYVTCVAK